MLANSLISNSKNGQKLTPIEAAQNYYDQKVNQYGKDSIQAKNALNYINKLNYINNDNYLIIIPCTSYDCAKNFINESKMNGYVIRYDKLKELNNVHTSTIYK